MPAAKPKALIVRHETKAELQARADKEAAFTTEYQLPKGTPAELKDYPIAAATWRRLMREFLSIEESYVISLDRDMLISYCMLVEQLEQLEEMRKVAYALWKSLGKKYEVMTKQEGDSDRALKIAVEVSGVFDSILKLDARADQKRKTLFAMQKSLYMTPRARAGATPRRKAPEQPKDEMEMLLEETPDANGEEE
mgnify:CR=1 FL=1